MTTSEFHSTELGNKDNSPTKDLYWGVLKCDLASLEIALPDSFRSLSGDSYRSRRLAKFTPSGSKICIIRLVRSSTKVHALAL